VKRVVREIKGLLRRFLTSLRVSFNGQVSSNALPVIV